MEGQNIAANNKSVKAGGAGPGTRLTTLAIKVTKQDKQHIPPGNEHLLTGWTRDHKGKERTLGCLPRIPPSLA